MQHWLMSEGFPAQFYNWSFNRKKKEKKKKGYKLVSSQDGSFMFFRTFLTSFSKSLRALCSSSKDFFIFLLSCLTETKILLVLLLWGGLCVLDFFWTDLFWSHIHCQLQNLKSLLSKTVTSCSIASYKQLLHKMQQNPSNGKWAISYLYLEVLYNASASNRWQIISNSSAEIWSMNRRMYLLLMEKGNGAVSRLNIPSKSLLWLQVVSQSQESCLKLNAN